MLDIPLNKALAAVEAGSCASCIGCALSGNCHGVACNPKDRKDGKNVIFKLVDMPERAGKTRLEAVVDRAKRLGMLDIRLNGNWSISTLECMEHTLDIIEQNKERLDGNAGE